MPMIVMNVMMVIVMMVMMVMTVVVMMIMMMVVTTSHLKQCGWKSLSRAWIREA